MVHLPETKKELKIHAGKKYKFFLRNKLDKACFQHDMAYVKSKHLTKRTQSDSVLRVKEFELSSDPKYGDYRRGLGWIVYKFFDKKSSGSGADAEPNYQLTNGCYRYFIRKFKKRKYLGCSFSWFAITEQIKKRNQVFIVCNWSAY